MRVLLPCLFHSLFVTVLLFLQADSLHSRKKWLLTALHSYLLVLAAPQREKGISLSHTSMQSMLVQIPSANSGGSRVCENHDWQLGQLAMYLNPLHASIESGPLKRVPLSFDRMLNFVSREHGRNFTGRRSYLSLFCCMSSAVIRLLP